MEFIPIEILESIIYLLNHADLNNLIQTYPISSINWSMLHLYRFGTYKSNLNYPDYYRIISAEDVKLKLKLNQSIDEITQLQILYLSNNKLTLIPDSIGNLTQLQLLDLSNNKLTSIPKSVLNLESSGTEIIK